MSSAPSKPLCELIRIARHYGLLLGRERDPLENREEELYAVYALICGVRNGSSWEKKEGYQKDAIINYVVELPEGEWADIKTSAVIRAQRGNRALRTLDIINQLDTLRVFG